MTGDTRSGGPWILLGAHLRREDIEAVACLAAFPAGELFVSALPFDEKTGTAGRELLQRAAVARRELLSRETFIAIRYGVQVQSAEDAAAKCEPHAAKWRQILEDCQGFVEVTLKVAAPGGTGRPDRRTAASGRAYLEELHRMRRGDSVDPAFRRDALRFFAPLARKSAWRPRDDGGTELAMLVDRTGLESVKASGLELKKLFPHVPFLLSGPWPLEVFADES